MPEEYIYLGVAGWYDAVARSALKSRSSHRSASGFVRPGLCALLSAWAVVGGVIAPWLQRRLSLRALNTAEALAGALLLAAAALLIPSPLVAVPVALLLLLAPAANAAMFAVMLRSTPEEMRGRVNNTTGMVAMSLAAVAPLIAGLLVEHVSDAWAMGAFAATSAVAAVLYLTMPGLRPPQPPAATPG